MNKTANSSWTTFSCFAFTLTSAILITIFKGKTKQQFLSKFRNATQNNGHCLNMQRPTLSWWEELWHSFLYPWAVTWKLKLWWQVALADILLFSTHVRSKSVQWQNWEKLTRKPNPAKSRLHCRMGWFSGRVSDCNSNSTGSIPSVGA